jgi:predicted CDP-diglyceride synthetase/phosphatidate cytidylyltransferase
MEILNAITSWFSSASWEQMVLVAGMWLFAFRELAKLTPTTKDDSVINWIYNTFAVLGLKTPELVYDKNGKIVAEK